MTVKTFLPGESKRDIRLTTAKAVVGAVCSPLTPGSRPGMGFVRRRPEANPSAFVDGEPLSKNISTKEPLNRRSLHCAPPDFLWRPVALRICMRLSLRRAAHVDVAS